MKNLDLNAYGVQEMNQQEMINVEGGGWLSDAFSWIGEVLENTWAMVDAFLSAVADGFGQ